MCLTIHCRARFARRYFSYLTAFFAFPPPPPHYGAWSQATQFFFRFLFSVGVLLSAFSSRNLSCTVLYLHPFRVGVGFTLAARLTFCGLRLSVPTSYVAPTLTEGGVARLLEHKNKRHENLATLQSHTFVSFQ